MPRIGKIEPQHWEPWKALSVAFGAGMAVEAGLIALATWILSHFLSAAHVP
jgi:hypothetical protein